MQKTIFIFLLLVAINAPAQVRDTIIVTDTGLIIEKVEAIDTLISMTRNFDPDRAMLLSAALPGLGQAYNKKYWKIPLVYGGFTFLAFQLNFYQDGFLTYKNYLFAEIGQNSNLTNPSGFNESQLRNIVDRYRRQRDFYIVYTGLFYLIQIVDAHIDAHLKEFDVNPKLQVRIEPSFEQNVYFSATGISLKLKF
jgi:hypothetical protein